MTRLSQLLADGYTVRIEQIDGGSFIARALHRSGFRVGIVGEGETPLCAVDDLTTKAAVDENHRKSLSLEDPNSPSRKEAEREILKLFATNRGLRPEDLSNRTGIDVKTIFLICDDLVDRGLIQPID